VEERAIERLGLLVPRPPQFGVTTLLNREVREGVGEIRNARGSANVA